MPLTVQELVPPRRWYPHKETAPVLELQNQKILRDEKIAPEDSGSRVRMPPREWHPRKGTNTGHIHSYSYVIIILLKKAPGKVGASLRCPHGNGIPVRGRTPVIYTALHM
jgi:hypothetical protein